MTGHIGWPLNNAVIVPGLKSNRIVEERLALPGGKVTQACLRIYPLHETGSTTTAYYCSLSLGAFPNRDAAKFSELLVIRDDDHPVLGRIRVAALRSAFLCLAASSNACAPDLQSIAQRIIHFSDFDPLQLASFVPREDEVPHGTASGVDCWRDHKLRVGAEEFAKIDKPNCEIASFSRHDNRRGHAFFVSGFRRGETRMYAKCVVVHRAPEYYQHLNPRWRPSIMDYDYYIVCVGTEASLFMDPPGFVARQPVVLYPSYLYARNPAGFASTPGSIDQIGCAMESGLKTLSSGASTPEVVKSVLTQFFEERDRWQDYSKLYWRSKSVREIEPPAYRVLANPVIGTKCNPEFASFISKTMQNFSRWEDSEAAQLATIARMPEILREKHFRLPDLDEYMPEDAFTFWSEPHGLDPEALSRSFDPRFARAATPEEMRYGPDGAYVRDRLLAHFSEEE